MNKFLSSRRYRRKIKYLYFKVYEKFFLDVKKIAENEEGKFSSAGLSTREGLLRLDTILEKLNRGYFERSVNSVHWLLFSCLSKTNKKFPRILEIGTSNGFGTLLLSELFKSSEIITVDLPNDDPLTRGFYGRKKDDKFEKYLKTQKENTNASNVQLIKTNSFFLLDKLKGPFDLIWIDGGHLYPDVAWDICNAWHLSKKGGYILIDDVIPTKRNHRTKLVSTDSSRVIDYISERANMHITYFLKRINAESESSKYRRKYVAFLEKL